MVLENSKVRVVPRTNGNYVVQAVEDWGKLLRLASGLRCWGSWEESTVRNFADSARELIGCCIQGDEDKGPITKMRYDEVVTAALERVVQYRGNSRY